MQSLEFAIIRAPFTRILGIDASLSRNYSMSVIIRINSLKNFFSFQFSWRFFNNWEKTLEVSHLSYDAHFSTKTFRRIICQLRFEMLEIKRGNIDSSTWLIGEIQISQNRRETTLFEPYRLRKMEQMLNPKNR